MRSNILKAEELNAHQRIARKIAWEETDSYVGGLENILSDCPEDDEEYISAKATLADHELLIDIIYDEVMYNSEHGSQMHLRFAGTDYIRSRIDGRLKKYGY